jgi:type II secretion system protein L
MTVLAVRWDGADDFQWREQGALRQGDAPALARAVGDAPIAVLLAAPLAWVGVQVLPRLAGRRLAQAAAFAVEDQLAGELDATLVAVGHRGADGRTEFAVMQRAALTDALNRLRAAGLDVVSLTPLAALLPADAATVLAEPGWLTARLGGQASLCGPPADMLAVLAALAPAALDWWQAPGAPPPPPQLAATVRSVPADWALSLAEAHAGIDLLQGDFAPPRPAGDWRRWRFAGLAAALWLALLLAGGLLEGRRLAQQNAALRQAVSAEFARLFPEEGRPVSPRAQAQRRLAMLERGAGAGGGELLPLLTAAAGALPAGQTLTGLDYESGRLTLDLALPDLQAAQTLRTALAARPGVRAELPVTVAQGGVVRTRVVLQAQQGQ